MYTRSSLKIITLSTLLSSLLYGGEYHLDEVAIEGKTEGAVVEEKVSKKSSELGKVARGETLGDYLENETFVDSASYGAAVGRPVVKGMDGYRVGITNGNIALNDLSAMSQDHAVGLMPRASQKIELIKGPASLLYGSYSGGVIRALGEEHNKEFAKEGMRAKSSYSYGTNGAGEISSLILEGSEADISAFISHVNHDAEAYEDGEGRLIKDSDTRSKQTHAVAGFRVNDENNIKLYYDVLTKEYGIPNATPERTSINLDQERYGVIWHAKELFDIFEYVQTEAAYSDYLHDELEDQSPDGLFGQKQLNLSTAFGVDFSSWHMDANVEYVDSELKVCHEHGGCSEFTRARRSSVVDGDYLVDNLNNYGAPYSHAHPMPNTDESLLKTGVALKNFINDSNEITLSLRGDARRLQIDSANIQEEYLVPTSLDPDYYNTINDGAMSASAGLYSFLNDDLTMQTSLSFVQRLPAASELFWNGYHHATNSYILGDRNLKNEESVNLDLDFVYNLAAFTTELGVFYYDFSNYIYQTPLLDSTKTPVNVSAIIGHNALAWEMQGAGAKVYGAALKESYKTQIAAHKLEASFAFEAMRGELSSGGYIPRMPPFSTTVLLQERYKKLFARVSYKYVDESRFEGAFETQTPSYGWLSASLEYALTLGMFEGAVFVKGENLTDELAYNHLSFLKATAPYAGRQVSGGLSLRF